MIWAEVVAAVSLSVSLAVLLFSAFFSVAIFLFSLSTPSSSSLQPPPPPQLVEMQMSVWIIRNLDDQNSASPSPAAAAALLSVAYGFPCCHHCRSLRSHRDEGLSLMLLEQGLLVFFLRAHSGCWCGFWERVSGLKVSPAR